MTRVRDEREVDIFKHRASVLERLSDNELMLLGIDERPVFVSQRLKMLEKLALGEIPPKTVAQKKFAYYLIKRFSTSLLLYGRRKLYLDCPYEDRKEVLKWGAQWDETQKKWYVPEGMEKTQFRKWWPSQDVTRQVADEDFNPDNKALENPYEVIIEKYLNLLLHELEMEFERADQLERESREQLNYLEETKNRWKQERVKSGEVGQ